ncbi:MAG: ribosome-associated translation inhibitor RaiA [Sphingobacteriia bacterium]|nr:ribosome-associated translation inhibitor RaiA [Sphingobacteriia bacterium]HPE33556.1 ribosome-associated translation inhibitor RaiA [Bacteroidales bacterium]HPR57023.1 ribosome-associated translation inhibitor RaiA [Bacteroidales bacterium]
MQIEIRSIHFKADRKLEDFINEKIEKLSQFYDGVLSAEVALKLDNNDSADNKIAEVILNVRGSELYAKKQSKSFEESVDNAADALRKQIVRYKEKQRRS